MREEQIDIEKQKKKNPEKIALNLGVVVSQRAGWGGLFFPLWVV